MRAMYYGQEAGTWKKECSREVYYSWRVNVTWDGYRALPCEKLGHLPSLRAEPTPQKIIRKLHRLIVYSTCQRFFL